MNDTEKNERFGMPYNDVRELTKTMGMSIEELGAIGRLMVCLGSRRDCEIVAELYRRNGDFKNAKKFDLQ
jgi:hypothetical protein